MRALLRYFLLTAAIVGLGYGAVVAQIDGRSVASHVRARFDSWMASRAKTAPEPVAKKPVKRAKKQASKPKRPEREIPPTELQSDEDARKRVSMLAEAAKTSAGERKGRGGPTRVTPRQKKALDELLTSRQSPH